MRCQSIKPIHQPIASPVFHITARHSLVTCVVTVSNLPASRQLVFKRIDTLVELLDDFAELSVFLEYVCGFLLECLHPHFLFLPASRGWVRIREPAWRLRSRNLVFEGTPLGESGHWSLVSEEFWKEKGSVYSSSSSLLRLYEYSSTCSTFLVLV